MERSLTLPPTVDPDRCSAELKAGVIRARLAKAPGAAGLSAPPNSWYAG
jgi:HSP20 family molecular chaperone IbpA